ncbi:MAG TPA: PIF1 family DEAD/DEAH box helicase [Candidatus Omnitrophota bacterium]|mgnify:FL=1|nr:PIF1 family DEAD/DEAH box helicase [Candidatus Omnitrophota bacterium]
MSLTPSQEKAWKLLFDTPYNTFLTGGPGTGKSFLIRRFFNESPVAVDILASTGAAAIVIGGRTFHSFFGLGIMQGTLQMILEKAVSNTRVKRRIKKAECIVIDEISMIPADALDAAEQVARAVRKVNVPWGGLRVIGVGDFAQLPPVSRNAPRKWCFDSTAWRRSDFQTAVLEDQVRTKDKSFLEVLNKIRIGILDEDVRAFLDGRVMTEEEVEDGVPRLFPRREQTDKYNLMCLNRLTSDAMSFPTEYLGEEPYLTQIKKDAPIPEVLELKKGAIVMFRMNDPKQRFVNGTVGRVEDFDEGMLAVEVNGETIEVTTFGFSLHNAEGDEVAHAMNFPVNLAYASTIHKIQGATMDRAHIDLRSLWEPGQAYVALSRVRTQKGLSLAGWTPTSIFADPAVSSFYSALQAAAFEAS